MIYHNGPGANVCRIVIGEFDEEHEKYIDLHYYWTNRILREDAMRTYRHTPEIIKYFENII
jgi:hypothetical protein